MALISQDELLDSQGPREGDLTPVPVEPEPDRPGFGKTLGAAFRLENEIGSALANTAPSDFQVRDPDYNPWNSLKDTHYLDFADRFLYADSDDEVEGIQSQIDRELEDKQILEDSGGLGIAASIAAGIASPTIAIPATASLKLSSGVGKILKGVASGAALTGGAVAVQEGILDKTQLTRDPDLAPARILAGSVLGGVLGGAIGTVSAVSQRAATKHIQEILENSRPEVVLKSDGSTQSVGAAAIKSPEQLKRENAMVPFINEDGVIAKGFSKILGITPEEVADGFTEAVHRALSIPGFSRGPVNDGLMSNSGLVRQFTDNMFEHVIRTRKAEQGITDGPSVETLIKLDQARMIRVNTSIQDLYLSLTNQKSTDVGRAVAAVKGLKKDNISFAEFNELVSKEVRNPSPNAAPQVKAAADLISKELEAFAEGLVQVGKFTDVPQAKTATRYLSRRYDRAKINSVEGHKIFKAKVVKWLLDPKKDKTGDELLDSANFTVDEASVKADEIIDNIMGLGDDGIQLDGFADNIINVGGGKIAKPRVFTIPDAEIEDFLVNDATFLYNSYASQASSLIRYNDWLNKNGFESLADLQKSVRDEYTDLIAKAKTDKARNKLDEAAKTDIERLGIYSEIMLGRYGRKGGKLNTGLRHLRKYQVATKLGGVVLSSVPDTAMHIWTHRLPHVIKSALVDLATNIGGIKASAKEMRHMGVGLELEESAMLAAFTDVGTGMPVREGALGKFLNAGLAVHNRVSLMGYWNRAHKRFAGRISMSETLEIMNDIASGKKVSKKALTRLSRLGIDEQMQSRILKQFEKHGEMRDSIPVAHIEDWDDLATAEAFASSVLKDVDSTILVPGKGDIPTSVQGSEIARSMFQFKTFAVSMQNKFVIPALQQRDGKVAVALFSLISMGALSYVIKTKNAGREPDYSVDNLIFQGLIRSGAMGLTMDAVLATLGNNPRFSEVGTTKYFLGPTASQGLELVRLANSLIDDGQLSESEKNTFKRMVPYYNIFYIQRLLKAMYPEEEKK